MDFWMLVAIILGLLVIKFMFGGQKVNMPAPRKRRSVGEFFPNGSLSVDQAMMIWRLVLGLAVTLGLIGSTLRLDMLCS
jgi:hypothetical protein